MRAAPKPGPAKADEERECIRNESPASKWKTPVERAIEIGANGIRLPTGFATLDEATRGGPLTGRLITIGGPPGGGKTGVLVQLARHYAAQGLHVAMHAADEEADGLLTRWGQLEGIDRESLEEGKLVARKALAEAMRRYPNLMIVDGDDEGATAENVASELARRAGGKPAVYLADSIQMLRATGSDNTELPPRERVDRVVAALKYAAKFQRHLVWATSELARGAYRSRRAADNINSLAAFKESGGIEYGVSAALVMMAVSGSDDLIDVGIPKNRMGRKLAFRLKQNFRLCQFVEVPVEEEAPELDDDEKEARGVEKVRANVLRTLSRATNLRSRTAVCKATVGRATYVRKAFDQLDAEGAIVQLDGTWRAKPTENGGGE